MRASRCDVHEWFSNPKWLSSRSRHMVAICKRSSRSVLETFKSFWMLDKKLDEIKYILKRDILYANQVPVSRIIMVFGRTFRHYLWVWRLVEKWIPLCHPIFQVECHRSILVVPYTKMYDMVQATANNISAKMYVALWN